MKHIKKKKNEVGCRKMIDEELLISYLQKQKRKYQERMIALHRKVENFSTNNYFRKYIPTCTYCESCESVCEKHAIWIVNPEWEELQ